MSHEHIGQPKSIAAALALQKAKDREAEQAFYDLNALPVSVEIEHGEYWWQREPRKWDEWMRCRG